MPRQKFEFRCTECDKYFDINLNTALEGNYRVHCPNCGHIHYRKVDKGRITDVRFTNEPERNNIFIIEDIVPMKSSCRDFKTEKPEDFSEHGFLSRLWHEKFSARV